MCELYNGVTHVDYPRHPRHSCAGGSGHGSNATGCAANTVCKDSATKCATNSTIGMPLTPCSLETTASSQW